MPGIPNWIDQPAYIYLSGCCSVDCHIFCFAFIYFLWLIFHVFSLLCTVVLGDLIPKAIGIHMLLDFVDNRNKIDWIRTDIYGREHNSNFFLDSNATVELIFRQVQK